jgi:type I restriction enzyme S subunit
MTSRSFQDEIIGRATGTSVDGLRQTEVLKLKLKLPPVKQQEQIGDILYNLNKKIELNRRMNTTLETMARALFQSWFVDFDPVRAKLDGRQPVGMDAATAALFPATFHNSQFGHIPEGWTTIGLPDAIDFLEGPGLRNWQYRDEGMKFLNIRCIGDGDLDIAKANSISLEEFQKTYKHFALEEDDIVISSSGTLGRLAVVRADHLPVMLNTSIIRMRGREAVRLAYVWGFLQSEYFLSEMFALAAGSVQLNFGPMHLRKISILRPPDRILEIFEHAAQPLLKKCLQLRKESRTLATLRDTLLPNLLSGELSVADAEEVVHHPERQTV